MKEKTTRAVRYLFMLTIALAMVATVKTKALAADDSIGIGGTSYKGDASGEGWTYDAESKTLTLNGFSYNGYDAGIYCENDSTFNIVLIGDNSITSADEAAIYANTSSVIEPTLNITGNGSLTVTSKSSDGIRCYGSITISGPNITATTNADTYSAITAGYNLIINNATVTAIATGTSNGNYAISGGMSSDKNDSKISITNSKVTATSNSTDGYGIFSNYGNIEIGKAADVTVNSRYNGIETSNSSHSVIVSGEVKSLIAIGDANAISSSIFKNSVPGTGYSKASGEEKTFTIEKSTEGQPIYDFYKVVFPQLLPTITTAPTALTPVYDSSEQALVTAGTATNGTMQYALGTDSTTVPGNAAFSADIPTGVDAGTYYVWYRALGNAGYGITAPKCITATISDEYNEPDNGYRTNIGREGNPEDFYLGDTTSHEFYGEAFFEGETETEVDENEHEVKYKWNLGTTGCFEFVGSSTSKTVKIKLTNNAATILGNKEEVIDSLECVATIDGTEAVAEGLPLTLYPKEAAPQKPDPENPEPQNPDPQNPSDNQQNQGSDDNNQNNQGNNNQNNNPADQSSNDTSQPDNTQNTTAKPAKKGTKVTDSNSKTNGKFKVTSSKEGKAEVSYTAPSNKKAKKITIPSTVKDSNGATYKVTKIQAKAFKKNKTVASVNIPKTVTTIGANAFNGASHLKTIKLNANTLKSVGSGAFKNIAKGATFTITAKDKKTFNKCVKMLKKAGAKNCTFKYKKGK